MITKQCQGGSSVASAHHLSPDIVREVATNATQISAKRLQCPIKFSITRVGVRARLEFGPFDEAGAVGVMLFKKAVEVESSLQMKPILLSHL